MSKEYERKVQTSEMLIGVATTRLLVVRLRRCVAICDGAKCACVR
jgi:hypothetical protein